MKNDTWRFRSISSGYEKTTKLWLYPELNCSACVDDCDSEDGAEQLAYYVDYLKRNYREWWDADAVSIYWSVEGRNVAEAAPCRANQDRSFLTSYEAPRSVETGEAINWFKLPVRNERFPKFAAALGWLPAPFQTVAPLRSIVQGIESAKR